MATEVSLTGIHSVKAEAVTRDRYSWINIHLNDGWNGGGRIQLHCSKDMAETLAEAINEAMARVAEDRADSASYRNQRGNPDAIAHEVA